MPIKLDENLGRTHVELLREAGYEADRVHEEGISGISDEALWERICTEGRLLITLDLDFSDVRRYPVGTHPGVLLLRPRNRSRTAAQFVLERIIREYDLKTFENCLVVADETQTRIRRASYGHEERNE